SAPLDGIEQPFDGVQRPRLTWRAERFSARIPQRDQDIAAHLEDRGRLRPGAETSNRHLYPVVADVARTPGRAPGRGLAQQRVALSSGEWSVGLPRWQGDGAGRFQRRHGRTV